jgi:transposase
VLLGRACQPATKRLHPQKKSLVAKERDPNKCAVFREKVAQIRPERLKFLDESGSHLALTRLYGWAKHDTRCVYAAPFNRGKNETLLGLFSVLGMEALQTHTGSVKAEQVAQFVQERVLPCLKPGDVLVLDNARIHKAALLRPLLEGVGCDLWFLPPYSPDFSPIEPAWGKIKSVLRHLEPREREALRAHIVQAAATVTPADAGQFYRHCGYPV